MPHKYIKFINKNMRDKEKSNTDLKKMINIFDVQKVFANCFAKKDNK